ncbi:hypothetical protein C5167_020730 [Papaver somniferum]|uniref:Uncharacterized protein n=1 Tax=Papaver somniferum TaxID=3469 RepID=A0A4Y7ITV5_PAPSO|nr:hypothetical protein C5167_020730 [Papaver somniferum]
MEHAGSILVLGSTEKQNCEREWKEKWFGDGFHRCLKFIGGIRESQTVHFVHDVQLILGLSRHQFYPFSASLEITSHCSGNKGDHFTTFRKDVMLPLTGFMSNNPQQSNRLLLYRNKLWLDPANVNVKEVICPLGCLLGATGMRVAVHSREVLYQ